jgi:transcriptional regulator with XRE-family HTH domain
MTRIDMENMFERIKTQRIKLGILQQDLADRLGVSKQTVSHWETGQRNPEADTIKKLADIFNVSSDYLLCRSETINNIDSLSTEEKELLDEVKDLPVDTIKSITRMIKNFKK